MNLIAEIVANHYARNNGRLNRSPNRLTRFVPVGSSRPGCCIDSDNARRHKGRQEGPRMRLILYLLLIPNICPDNLTAQSRQWLASALIRPGMTTAEVSRLMGSPRLTSLGGESMAEQYRGVSVYYIGGVPLGQPDRVTRVEWQLSWWKLPIPTGEIDFWWGPCGFRIAI